jgi:murein DD-endopeptidase MepM/ murein hydrolase activator NlpD
MSTNQEQPPSYRRRGMLAAAVLGCLALVLVVSSAAPAQDLQSELDSKQAQLDSEKQQAGVLSTTIERYSDQIDTLTGQVATLRNREALVQERLNEVQAKLDQAVELLNKLRDRYRRSLEILKERLVDIYKSDEPDALTVILQSDGFDDLLERYEYLTSIQEQDTALVTRVHNLRDKTQETVIDVREARDEIAARKAELARTRAQLEAREADLSAAQDQKQAALRDTQGNIEELEGDISDIQADIQAQIAAAQAAAAESAEPLPAGPVQQGSGGWIWPVNGPITSPFCEQRAWESCHPGIDIAVPAGTPIRAADSGRVILMQSEASSGGYGNYTCIDHGGGLSSCYAHQSSFATSQGATVQQGQVIGYVGCTGLCFGDHLHFEARVNGTPVDPMGYL